jgi:hypothetical protein
MCYLSKFIKHLKSVIFMKPVKNISVIIISLAFISLVSLNIDAQVDVGVGVTVRVAPPALPVYAQPPCPVDGYIWTPGYWAYGTDDYYWVPGVWVRPPHYGYLWTPCYWGFSGGYYGFHPGYWGPHIGFYGGVNYGFGYWGSGFYGGRWEGNVFRYNTAVVNVNKTVIHNTYIDRTVVNKSTSNRSSFNGQGGVMAKPTSQEETAFRENHVAPTSEQNSHEQFAGKNRNQFASVNKGRPSTPAMNKVDGQAFNSKGKMATARSINAANNQSGARGNKSARRSANPKHNHRQNKEGEKQK